MSKSTDPITLTRGELRGLFHILDCACSLRTVALIEEKPADLSAALALLTLHEGAAAETLRGFLGEIEERSNRGRKQPAPTYSDEELAAIPRADEVRPC